MIKFILGFIIGSFFGVAVMTLMIAAKWRDKIGDISESYQDGYKEGYAVGYYDAEYRYKGARNEQIR